MRKLIAVIGPLALALILWQFMVGIAATADFLQTQKLIRTIPDLKKRAFGLAAAAPSVVKERVE